MNITQINLEHRIPLQGVYNAYFNACDKCESNFGLGNGLIKNIIGFAERRSMVYCVVECPVCFHKYYFHLRDLILYENWKAVKFDYPERK